MRYVFLQLGRVYKISCDPTQHMRYNGQTLLCFSFEFDCLLWKKNQFFFYQNETKFWCITSKLRSRYMEQRCGVGIGSQLSFGATKSGVEKFYFKMHDSLEMSHFNVKYLSKCKVLKTYFVKNLNIILLVNCS